MDDHDPAALTSGAVAGAAAVGVGQGGQVLPHLPVASSSFGNSTPSGGGKKIYYITEEELRRIQNPELVSQISQKQEQYNPRAILQDLLHKHPELSNRSATDVVDFDVAADPLRNLVDWSASETPARRADDWTPAGIDGSPAVVDFSVTDSPYSPEHARIAPPRNSRNAASPSKIGATPNHTQFGRQLQQRLDDLPPCHLQLSAEEYSALLQVLSNDSVLQRHSVLSSLRRTLSSSSAGGPAGIASDFGGVSGCGVDSSPSAAFLANGAAGFSASTSKRNRAQATGVVPPIASSSSSATGRPSMSPAGGSSSLEDVPTEPSRPSSKNLTAPSAAAATKRSAPPPTNSPESETPDQLEVYDRVDHELRLRTSMTTASNFSEPVSPSPQHGSYSPDLRRGCHSPGDLRSGLRPPVSSVVEVSPASTKWSGSSATLLNFPDPKLVSALSHLDCGMQPLGDIAPCSTEVTSPADPEQYGARSNPALFQKPLGLIRPCEQIIPEE
ncbi:unnamed protein product [Amoebophrya sp. A120]|nr:unnamed protein product [Amoebophrya sp. A120]|eukprot:GSA120T00005196001.1